MLTNSELVQYQRDGFLILPKILDDCELELLDQAIKDEVRLGGPALVYEKSTTVIRALHGCHKTNAILNSLCELYSVCAPVQQIIGQNVYVYQFKINFKEKLSGERWPWHRDFTFWREEDGMIEAMPVSIAILIDDSTALNGPLCFIPRSQKVSGTVQKKESQQGDWRSHVSSDLKYTVPDNEVIELSNGADIVPFIGKAGDAVLFDSQIVHGSSCNISTSSRRLIIITYNSLSNAPAYRRNPRPEFLVESRPCAVKVRAEGNRLNIAVI